MGILFRLIDIVVPRFITEEVACVDVGDHFEIMCALSDLGDSEHYDKIVTIKSFNFFGFALFPRLVE